MQGNNWMPSLAAPFTAMLQHHTRHRNTRSQDRLHVWVYCDERAPNCSSLMKLKWFSIRSDSGVRRTRAQFARHRCNVFTLAFAASVSELSDPTPATKAAQFNLVQHPGSDENAECHLRSSGYTRTNLRRYF